MGSTLVLPGQTVIPKGYGESMVLYSEDGAQVVVDGAPPGPNGRLFIIPAKKPIKVPYEVGRHLLNSDQFPFLDVVRVEETESDTGIEYDVAGAQQASKERRKAADWDMFSRYVSDAVTDFVKQNKPVPNPTQKIKDMKAKWGWDVEDYGIHPIGWKRPEDPQVSEMKAQMEELKAQIAALKVKKG